MIFDEFDEQTRNDMFSTIEAALNEESLVRQMDVNSKKVCKSLKENNCALSFKNAVYRNENYAKTQIV